MKGFKQSRQARQSKQDFLSSSASLSTFCSSCCPQYLLKQSTVCRHFHLPHVFILCWKWSPKLRNCQLKMWVGFSCFWLVSECPDFLLFYFLFCFPREYSFLVCEGTMGLFNPHGPLHLVFLPWPVVALDQRYCYLGWEKNGSRTAEGFLFSNLAHVMWKGFGAV